MGIGTVKPAVFFDRDGVLNLAFVRGGKPHPPATLGKLRFDPDAKNAVRKVCEAGFTPVIVTNQPDVARGMQVRAVVEQLNDAVARETGIRAVYTCYHDNADGCSCRKPQPGLIVRAAEELELALPRSYLIGDRANDVLAGRAAGCTTVFIDRGYGETPGDLPASVKVASLRDAVEWILERERNAAA